MAAFQNNVVRIATIVFIAFMALVSLMLLLAKENQQFPPMYPTCPDYYGLIDFYKLLCAHLYLKL